MAESPFKFCSDCGRNEWVTKSDREFVCGVCGFRHFITPIPAAVALILDAQDRVLIIRRAHEPGYGKLGLPGGVINCTDYPSPPLRCSRPPPRQTRNPPLR